MMRSSLPIVLLSLLASGCADTEGPNGTEPLQSGEARVDVTGSSPRNLATPEDTTSSAVDIETTDERSQDVGPTPRDVQGSPEDTATEALVSDPRVMGAWSYTVSTHTEPLTSGESTEDVLLVLYLPEGEGPFPVVVFTHGFQLAPANYKSYGEHLASWGYLAILPQLPGGLFDGPNHVDLKRYLSALLDWVDAEALNVNGPLGGQADAEAIGLAGHSMGGKISLLLATEDPRPMAIFGVDPVDAAGGPFEVDPADYPSVTPELMPLITAPLGLIGETTNGTGDGGFAPACAPSEENFQQYFLHATSPAIEVDILGASHMSFLDDPDCGLACFACPAGTDAPALTRSLTQGYMTAFFNLFMRSEEGYRHYLTGDAMDADIAEGLVTAETKNGF